MERAMRTIFMCMFDGQRSLQPQDFRFENLLWKQFQIMVREEITIAKPLYHRPPPRPRIIPMSPTMH